MIPQSLDLKGGRKPSPATNREEWLINLAVYLRPWFEKRGHPIPESVTLSVGSMTNVRRTLGVCWSPDRSGVRQIVISPFVDDPLLVAGTLCHELVHAILPANIGHRSPFNQTCEALGLTEGKGTTRGPGAELAKHLEWIISRIGEYPHKAIDPIRKIDIEAEEEDVAPADYKGPYRLFCPQCKSILRFSYATFQKQVWWLNPPEIECCNPPCMRNVMELQQDR